MKNNAPQEGKPFPQWSSPAVQNDAGGFEESTLSSEGLAGKPYVLFFYPRDATPGCTIEVCGFRDRFADFAKLGVEVLGASRDTIAAHKKFIEKQQLPYPLLSDKERTLIDEWGLLVNKTMYGKAVTGVSRDTYYVDGDGILVKLFHKVSPLGHAQEVLEFVRNDLAGQKRSR